MIGRIFRVVATLFHRAEERQTYENIPPEELEQLEDYATLIFGALVLKLSHDSDMSVNNVVDLFEKTLMGTNTNYNTNEIYENSTFVDIPNLFTDFFIS